MDNLSVNGLLKAPQLRITGSDTNHNIVIENNAGSEVARFYNDYRCRFNGDTTILGNASVSGTLYSSGPVTCNQTLMVLEDATVEGARDHVRSTITNNQVNGFSSLYFKSTSGSPATAETCQIFCGQGTGLNVCTNTTHPIRFTTDRFAPDAPTSMQILGTGTRDVEINVPLK